MFSVGFFRDHFFRMDQCHHDFTANHGAWDVFLLIFNIFGCVIWGSHQLLAMLISLDFVCLTNFGPWFQMIVDAC